MWWGILWIIIAAIVVTVDLITSSFCFVLLSIGSLASIICVVLGFDLNVQIVAFVVVNIFSIYLGYPVFKKKSMNIDKIPLQEEKYIGQEYEADKQIKNTAQILLNGQYWTVVNTGETIEIGDKFKIIAIEGIKLKINKIKRSC